jgi:hypothetical protein
MPSSVLSGSHPNSVEATILSGADGLRKAYLPAASMASSMYAHDGRRFPSVDCPQPPGAPAQMPR